MCPTCKQHRKLSARPPKIWRALVTLLMLAVPELRPKNATRNFNNDLANADYDLDLWR